MKIKFNAQFICPDCGRFMFPLNIRETMVMTCYTNDCKNYDKYFKLPETEVEEYENRDSKKSD